MQNLAWLRTTFPFLNCLIPGKSRSQVFLLNFIVLCVVNRVCSPSELMEIIQFLSPMALNQKTVSVGDGSWPSWPCASWDWNSEPRALIRETPGSPASPLSCRTWQIGTVSCCIYARDIVKSQIILQHSHYTKHYCHISFVSFLTFGQNISFLFNFYNVRSLLFWGNRG